MIDLTTILELPKTSNGFTAPGWTTDNHLDDGTSSPPRKAARLGTSSDTSASRPHRQIAEKQGTGPIRIRIVLDEAPPAPSHAQKINQVQRCIRVLLTRDSPERLPLPCGEIHSACRSIVCVSDAGDGLYTATKLEMEQCVGRLAKEFMEDKRSPVQVMAGICEWFVRQVSLLQSLLAYLDQIYVYKNKDVSKIRDLSYELFTDRVFRKANITEKLRESIKDWVTWERRKNGGIHAARDYVKELIDHLNTFGLYSTVFESYYIELTHSFYAAEALDKGKSSQNEARDYLENCKRRLIEEEVRASVVLPIQTWGLVRETAEHALMDGQMVWIAQEAMPIIYDRTDKLTTMYELFSRVGGLDVLLAAFKAHIQKNVQDIIKDSQRDEEMVQRLLELKATGDTAISSAFIDSSHSLPSGSTAADGSANNAASSSKIVKQPNRKFAYALTDAFTLGFKARRNKPAEMIAKYIDKEMRRGQRDRTDADFEALLDSVLALYRFTDDKDVFRTFYHRALAKRLLLERSASDDFEKSILKKLKEQYDPEFGMGDQMFTDLALSRDAMREYYQREGQDVTQRLSVMVLQRSVWPFSVRLQDIDLPLNMQDEITRFSKFYKEKHENYKIDWDHALGTATLKSRFKAGTKELSVTLYQAVILLLFNESDEISFQSILEQTRMADADLRRNLQSLACGKKKVLKKTPAGKDVEDGDVFHFNADFTDPRAKVHITSIQVKETPEESKRTQISIEGDRRHSLDAAIVRIMKARKELSYEHLKLAVIDAVKNHFVPEVSDIKKRVDSLVESEYMRRDDEDKTLLIYIA